VPSAVGRLAGGEARQWRTAAGAGKQMVPCSESIGGGGMAGGGSGERRRRGRGGAPASARVPARVRAMRGNKRRWELR
jgi:hypothetical protein